MIDYVLYVIGSRSFFSDGITVQGVFPNINLAEKVRNVIFPGSDIFIVNKTDVLFYDDGIDIPFFSKKL